MSLVLETDTGSSIDISTAMGGAVGAYTNSTGRDLFIRARCDLSGLNAAGANIKYSYNTAIAGLKFLWSAARAKRSAANTTATIMGEEIFVANGEAVILCVNSDNASDSSVAFTTKWLDCRAVDVERFVNVLAALQDGYPKVDVYSVGGETPGSHDAVIPASPTVGSINDLMRKIKESLNLMR